MLGHRRDIRTMLFTAVLGRRRMRLPTSHWKDSSFFSSVKFSIHDSAPYNRMGKTQHSTILLDDSGFKVPWKSPLPLAPLAFLMLESIHLTQEGEEDHQAPRHLAVWETGMSIPSILMWDRFLGFEGEMTASHFSVLRQRFLELAKELTACTWLLQSLRLVDRVQISSAWDSAPRKKPFKLRPQDFSRTTVTLAAHAPSVNKPVFFFAVFNSLVANTGH